MSLTFGGGPLSKNAPETVNYTLSAPRHALFMQPFPRRVRAVLAGTAVLDTVRGHLLHETGLMPQLYVPAEDLRGGSLTPSDHTTHCPYKGDAAYWHLTVGGRTAENAVWAYPDPRPEASWLRGLSSLYWDAADSWFDEEEEVHAHLRDPYHRVDTRPASVLVRVRHGDQVVALSGNARVLSETGLPNRYYIPADDVRTDLLVPSGTDHHCPYKGRARYWHLRTGDRDLVDAAWSFTTPLSDGRDVRDHYCFLHDELETTTEPK
ncbi:DUF427 domain-containing protein [Nocardiopsis sp. CNT-189]|uniref:DUF427 domain-containing protein n=1 Tax=Nocardiopsis oceanisediminis TaxID=2816862 RepID=UPI003B387721